MDTAHTAQLSLPTVQLEVTEDAPGLVLAAARMPSLAAAPSISDQRDVCPAVADAERASSNASTSKTKSFAADARVMDAVQLDPIFEPFYRSGLA
jgi:hypothetical protein